MPPAMQEIPRIGVLGSGRGTNFKAILDAIEADELTCEPRIVISDVATAPILELGRAAGIRAEFVEPGPKKSRLSPEAERRVIELLEGASVDWVVLAGFMRLVGKRLLEAYEGRMVNIHPSLLPKFRGLEAWRQALEAGEEVTGCTVHYVDAGMDTGSIIAQAEVPVEEGDTPETLHARIQQAEHRLLPDALRMVFSRT